MTRRAIRRIASARHRRRTRGSCVLDRDHRNAVIRLIELVDDQHPTPRAQNEPQTGPATLKLRSNTWEPLNRSEGPPDALTGIRRKREGEDQAVKILDGRNRQCDLHHELKVVEPDRLGRSLT